MGIRAGVLVVMAVLTLSACGAEGPDPEPNLFGDYLGSTTVEHDRFVSTGSSEDRMANFAAYYTVEQLQARLFSAFDCEPAPGTGQVGGDYFNTTCDLTEPVRAAVSEVGGSADDLTARVVIVKHDDGSLELLTLFVAGGKVIDGNGDIHDGLDDFRDGNDLLDSDDLVMTPRNLTAVPGEGEIVVVYGHTTTTWPWWLLGGAVVLLAGVVVVRRIRRAPAEE